MFFKPWLWIGAGFIVLLLILYQFWLLAHVAWWVKHNPSTSAFMEQRLEIMQEKIPMPNCAIAGFPMTKFPTT